MESFFDESLNKRKELESIYSEITYLVSRMKHARQDFTSLLSSFDEKNSLKFNIAELQNDKISIVLSGNMLHSLYLQFLFTCSMITFPLTKDM